MSAYVYILSEPGLYTVGFYEPNGRWKAESDHDSRESAAARVHYLNGGSGSVGTAIFESKKGEKVESTDL